MAIDDDRLTAYRQRQRAKRANLKLQQQGISVPRTTATIPSEETWMSQSMVEEVPKKKGKSFWDKVGGTVSGSFMGGVKWLEDYVATPWRGIVSTMSYQLPGEQVGEKEWREYLEEAEGTPMWGSLKAASGSFQEEAPGWSTFTVDLANPAYWVTPGSVVGKGAGVAGKVGYAGKTVTMGGKVIKASEAISKAAEGSRLSKAAARLEQSARAGQHGRKAQALFKAKRAGELTAAAEAGTPKFLVKTAPTWAAKRAGVYEPIAMKMRPLAPVAEKIGKYPLGRVQQITSELTMQKTRQLGRLESFHPRNWFKYTRQASRDQASTLSVDVGKDVVGVIPRKSARASGQFAAPYEAADTLRLFTENNPRVMDGLTTYAKSNPKQIQRTQEIYQEAQKLFRESVDDDLFEACARTANGDTGRFFEELSRQCGAAEARRVGLIESSVVVTNKGAKELGLVPSSEMYLKPVDLRTYTQKGWVKQVDKLVHPNKIFRAMQQIKSSILYPALLVGRPGWATMNTMYNESAILLSEGMGGVIGTGREIQGMASKWVSVIPEPPPTKATQILEGFQPATSHLVKEEVIAQAYKQLPARDKLRKLISKDTLKGIPREIEEIEVGGVGRATARQHGFTEVVLHLGQKIRTKQVWQKFGILSEYPRAIQAWSEQAEARAHKILYHKSWERHFPENLRTVLGTKIKEGKLSPRQADLVANCTDITQIDRITVQSRGGADLLASDVFPKMVLDHENIPLWDTMMTKMYPEGIKDVKEMRHFVDEFRTALGEKMESRLDDLIKMEADEVGHAQMLSTEVDDAISEIGDVIKQTKELDIPAKAEAIGLLEEAQADMGRWFGDFVEQRREFHKVHSQEFDAHLRHLCLEKTEMAEIHHQHYLVKANLTEKYMEKRVTAMHRDLQRMRAAVMSGEDPAPLIKEAQATQAKLANKLDRDILIANKNADKIAQEALKGKKPRAQKMEPLVGEEEARNIYSQIVPDEMNPFVTQTTTERVHVMYQEQVRRVEEAYTKFLDNWEQPFPGWEREQINEVYNVYADAIAKTNAEAVMDTNTFLFSYGNKTQMDYALMHISPFPFFQERHMLAMASYALNHPRKVAMFANMVNNWYEMNKDMPASQRLAIGTNITLPGGATVNFRPLAWFQPTNYSIMELIAMGHDEKENLDLVETINMMQDFTGGFIHPQLEIGGAVGLKAVGLDRFVQNRYGVFREPDEALKSMLPQVGLMTNACSSSKPLAKELIESDVPGFSLTQQQKDAVVYMLGEMVDEGEITKEQADNSAMLLINGMADDYNVTAATRALGRELWPRMAQFSGLPITAYTPGWQRSQMVKNKLEEGTAPGMERVYAPGYIKAFKETLPGTDMSRYVPPASLSSNLRTTWRQTVNYWHGADAAKAEQKAWQLRIDEAYQLGEIDGQQWVDLRNEGYQGYQQTLEYLNEQNPRANITKEDIDTFNSSLGKTAGPVHSYKTFVEDYYKIELGEGFPADYGDLSEKRTQYINLVERLDPKAAEYLRWYISRNLTPVEKEYKKVVETMQPYWNIEKVVFEQRGLLDLYSQTRNNSKLQEQLRQTSPEYVEAMREVSKLRKLIREAYPEIQAAGEKFWGFQSIFSSGTPTVLGNTPSVL